MDDYPSDGYVDEEEEWDREGLLDPAWEKQQKKVCKLMPDVFGVCRFYFVRSILHKESAYIFSFAVY